MIRGLIEKGRTELCDELQPTKCNPHSSILLNQSIECPKHIHKLIIYDFIIVRMYIHPVNAILWKLRKHPYTLKQILRNQNPTQNMFGMDDDHENIYIYSKNNPLGEFEEQSKPRCDFPKHTLTILFLVCSPNTGSICLYTAKNICMYRYINMATWTRAKRYAFKSIYKKGIK